MPVTKTAKRALRSSRKKAEVNKSILKKMEIAIRLAKKTLKETDITKAISLVDKAAKKKVIHKNKASRAKRTLSKLIKSKIKKVTKSKSKSK
jgi:small subunit ribosomal protein S20